MKTTKVFIGLFSVLAVANLFLSEWLIFGYVVLCLIFNVLLLHEENKNAQLTSKLTDAERDSRYWKERFDLANVWNKKDAEHIQELSAQLETAKANSYTEVERKRGREKYARLYKGKKKAEDQPYTIEGKTIKQLVEENLGIEVDTQFGNAVYLCGYDKEFGNSDIHANWSPFLVGNNSENYRHTSTDDVILKQFSNILWRNTTDVINAIKKHRNIQ